MVDNATPLPFYGLYEMGKGGSGTSNWAGLALESVGRLLGTGPPFRAVRMGNVGAGWANGYGGLESGSSVRVVSPIPEAMTSVVDSRHQQPQGCLIRHTHPSTVRIDNGCSRIIIRMQAFISLARAVL